jgi:hypothetical protein
MIFGWILKDTVMKKLFSRGHPYIHVALILSIAQFYVVELIWIPEILYYNIYLKNALCN